MKYQCRKCGGQDVRRQLSFLANPNETEDDISEMIAYSNWEWDDFEWCADCQDATILDEVEDSQDSD